MESGLIVKNMVCDRCIRSVQSLLEKLDIPFSQVSLGHVDLKYPLTATDKEKLHSELGNAGFELLEDRESQIINKVKTEIINLIQQAELVESINLSTHLSNKLNKEYTTISKLFSQVEGRTIEKYFIEQRIEKAKELLMYDNHSLSEIADILGFSSVAHLSAQFKKLTGMTPSYFKQLGSGHRKPIDKI